MKLGLVGRIWLTTVVLSVGALLVLGVVFSRLMTGLYEFHLSEHMASQAAGLVRMFGSDPALLQTYDWAEMEQIVGARVLIYNEAELHSLAAGLVPGSTGRAAKPVLPADVAAMLLAGGGTGFRDQTAPALHVGHDHDGATESFVFVLPLLRQDGGYGALGLASPFTPVAEQVERFQRYLLLLGAALVGLVTLLALVLSRKLSSPLLEMDGMARAMAAGDFGRRVRAGSGDEIGRLGSSINTLAEHLEQTIGQLARNNAQLTSILSSMSDGVLLVDRNRCLTFLNPRADALAAQAGIACTGRPAASSDPDCLQRLGIAAAVEQVLGGGRRLQQQVQVAGSEYAVHLAPLHNDDGAVHGVVAVWQDITGQQRLERMRRSFVANVSHEMRTPLSLVRGYVEVLQDGLDAPGPERQEHLQIIAEELARVEKLVADLLELARLDTGGIETEPVALGPFVAYLARKLTPLYARDGVQLQAAVPADLPAVRADADRLEQVLLNLLDNAVRFSPPGAAVRITASRQGGYVVVQVHDQGPGIPAADLELVWERFFRGDQARSRQKGGTGLGLAIVRGIIEGHGGRVWAESPPGGGAVFSFTLPVALPDAIGQDAPPPQ